MRERGEWVFQHRLFASCVFGGIGAFVMSVPAVVAFRPPFGLATAIWLVGAVVGGYVFYRNLQPLPRD